MRLRTSVFLLAILSLTICASSQTVNIEKDRIPVTELTGPWRFHTGDDPSWANPGVDDSSWSLLTANEGWSTQGYLGYTGIAWYRLRIAPAPDQKDLALYLPTVGDSCQIFVNSKLIGQVGEMPPHGRYINSPGRELFSIPSDSLIPGQPPVLAIRVWRWPFSANSEGGGLVPPPRIGDPQTLADWRSLQHSHVFWRESLSMIELFGNGLIALACFGLFALRRRELEYLWFGLNLSTWCLFLGFEEYYNYWSVPYSAILLVNAGCFTVAFAFLIEFYITFLKQRRSWLYWSAILFYLLFTFGVTLAGRWPGLFSQTAFNSAGFVYLLCEIAILVLGVRQRIPDARLLLAPVLVNSSWAIILLLRDFFPGWHLAQVMAQALLSGIQWPFPMFGPQLSADLGTIAVLAILVRRFARSRRDEERMDAELEAARVVQKVLIPEEIPAIPGFEVHTAYIPAGQVGGDFFQVVAVKSGPHDGAALIVIGDVSGKGMPAAMTVSLLVGTFRTLAQYTQSPGEILSKMNQRMLARSKDGFTTCLVLRADPDGKVTLANAGHIAPYLAGNEVAVDNGLPLGLAADAVYAESTLQLTEGDRLTLITDGVVEAQSPTRELFGFERTQAISTGSAEAIAHAAQTFGQEDDITVLTLAFAGAA
jgi:sigma-B regulation protein RsbU (phosphoserine phosphatase)